MPYRFKRKESVPHAIRRIVTEQATSAAHELGGGNQDVHDGVHNARKSFKKIRSLLRLMRSELGETTYKRENSWFRRAAHRLARARDAEALLETYDKLSERFPEMGEGPMAGLHQKLIERREHIVEEQLDLSAEARELAAKLERMPTRLDAWRLRKKGFKALKQGLTKGYRRGRKTFEKAFADPSDERFHEWRKRVKDYWYHSRLLQRVWPEFMDARIEQLKRLSDLLGDDHDLSVLRTTLERDEKAFGEGAAMLYSLAGRRQEELRAEARALGQRIYVMESECAVDQMKGLWKVWKDG